MNARRSLAVLAVAFCALVAGRATAGDDPVRADWALLEDAGGRATIEQVTGPLASQFGPVGSGNLSYDRGAAWLRLRWTNRASVPVSRVLDPCRAWVDDVRFYDRDEGYRELRAGAEVPFAQRPFPHERSLLRLTLAPGASGDVLIRISGSEPLSFNPRLVDAELFAVQDGAERFWYGAFLGIVVAIALYQGALYWAMRDPSHPTLFGLLLAYGLGEACAHGIAGRFFPALVPLMSRLTPMLFAIVGVMLMRLTELLVGGTHARWFRWAQWGYLALAVLALVTPWTHCLVYAADALMIPVCIYLGVAQRRTVGSTARWYVLAMSTFLAFAVFPVGEFFGVFPLRLWTENAAHVGAVALSLLLSMAVADRLARLHSGALRFVPKLFLEQLGRRDLSQVELGDCIEATLTVLFSDIRSFTTRSEKLSARATFDFLNEYLGRAVPRIRAHGGFVDKYIGDAVMALFPGRPDDAVRAAIEMQRTAQEPVRGQEPIEIGVALHTGPMMLGTIGEPRRMEATVISDAVNLASRLEGLTKRYGARVLLSAEVVARLERPQDFRLRRLGRTHVKGRVASVEMFEVLDAEPDEVAQRRLGTLPEFEAGLSALERGDLETARAHGRRVLERDPSDPATRALLAEPVLPPAA